MKHIKATFLAATIAGKKIAHKIVAQAKLFTAQFVGALTFFGEGLRRAWVYGCTVAQQSLGGAAGFTAICATLLSGVVMAVVCLVAAVVELAAKPIAVLLVQVVTVPENLVRCFVAAYTEALAAITAAAAAPAPAAS
jgi:hypothetical protein